VSEWSKERTGSLLSHQHTLGDKALLDELNGMRQGVEPDRRASAGSEASPTTFVVPLPCDGTPAGPRKSRLTLPTWEQ